MKKIVKFTSQQIAKIQQRFNEFSFKQQLSLQQFKNSMGLLGIGQGQPITERIFKLITSKKNANFDDFITFLDTITNGTKQQKAELSFLFLDRARKGYINYTDIEVIISEVSFLWFFLTGEQISNSVAIDFICGKLGIDERIQIGANQYFLSYDQQFNWFDYFNHKVNPSTKQFLNPPNRLSKIVSQTNKDFPIDQMEEYLKLLKNEMQNMIVQLKSETNNEIKDQEESKSMIWQVSSIKGPQLMSPVQFKLKGDTGLKQKYTPIKVIRSEQLQKSLTIQGQNTTKTILHRLKELSEMPNKLLKFPGNSDSIQNNSKLKSIKLQKNRFSYVYSADDDKKTIINKTQPSSGKRQNIVYFGHENWNLMINVMLGIRRSIKQHFFIYQHQVHFSEEDLNCKYINELLYKKNNKSIKKVSQIFIDYCPKVFFYVRKWFNINNQDYLKSIGLENLIGNLLLGNLSTLTDQTSEGKSGSFLYYTEDSKLILKSISRQQYKKFRQILKDYVQYLRQNPQTFLVKIYGLYKLKSKNDNRQIYFIVLNNVFDKGLQIDERYDIKGSTYNRQSKSEYQQDISKNIALKDMDLINNQIRTFQIPLNRKQKIYNQILADCQFLSNHNIIQYSLLVGISQLKDQRHTISRFSLNSQQLQEDQNQIFSIDKSQQYFFGVIDILSEYSVKKAFQNHFFHAIGKDISCLAPNDYFLRFQNFIYKYIFSA